MAQKRRRNGKLIDEGVNLLTYMAATRRRDELVKRAERLLEAGKVGQADKALREAERLTRELKRVSKALRDAKWKWPGKRRR